MGQVFEFAYSEWLKVEAATPEGARRFLGLPADARVEWFGPSAQKGAQVWRVWVKGVAL